MKIKKLLDNARLPEKATTYAAGYDLFSTEDYILEPKQRHLFKTGIAMEIPEGVYGRIAPRSGFAYKNGIDVLAGVIDADYRNDVGVILYNTGDEPFEVKEGMAIAQIVFEQHQNFPFVEVDVLSDIDRGGGFGSTDK